MLKVDLEVIKPFIDATLDTFKDQCQFEATAQAPYLKGTRDQQQFDIIAIIGLTSSTLRGSISLCFPARVFLAVMNGMLNENFKVISQELEDGAAELLNIIYGGAKTTLNDVCGVGVEMSIPTVIKGDRVSSGYSKGTVVVIPFESKVGQFYLEFMTSDLSLGKEKNTGITTGPKKLDAMVFQPFVNETITTLKTMCNIDVLPVKAYYKHEGPLPVFDIAGVVGVMGAKIQGSFTLCMEKGVFLKIMSRMMGQELSEMNNDIEDGAAELVNIIFGQAKRVLNEAGYSIKMAIPTIVKGKSVTSNYFSKNPVIILPFTSAFGQFWIEFTYE